MPHIKKITPLILSLLILFSCESNDSELQKLQTDYGDWIALEIPNGREANAISGSLDDILVVTTNTKVYSTKDAGKNWIEVADFQGPMPGLLERNDTLFIFSAKSSSNEFKMASTCLYFSIDKGLTWQYTNLYPKFSIPVQYVETEFDISYKIKPNIFKLDGSSNNYIGPSDIYRIKGKNKDIINIPFRYRYNNLHLDAKNHLYVAAAYGEVQENGTIISGHPDEPALVFISKNPLP